MLLLFAPARHGQSLLHDGVGHVQLPVITSLIGEFDIRDDTDMINVSTAGGEVVRGRQAEPRAILQRKDRLDRPLAITLGADEGRLL